MLQSAIVYYQKLPLPGMYLLRDFEKTKIKEETFTLILKAITKRRLVFRFIVQQRFKKLKIALRKQRNIAGEIPLKHHQSRKEEGT